MKGKERREKIIALLTQSDVPIAGKRLAETFGVSRQVIVQDIALLRAQNYEITPTTLGYELKAVATVKPSRVFKVVHKDEEVEEEMNLIVDYGGSVDDVFVYHKIYGTINARLDIHSREDVKKFVTDLQSGRSSLLKNVTSNYHYHTVTAPTEKILDLIQQELGSRGFLAQLQDYEPIDFWKDSKRTEG